MKYGRTVFGKTWHMLVDGKALCMGKIVCVETLDDAPRENVCENCDKNLREKGKARAPKRPPASKADYKPRHKFEDW